MEGMEASFRFFPGKIMVKNEKISGKSGKKVQFVIYNTQILREIHQKEGKECFENIWIQNFNGKIQT